MRLLGTIKDETAARRFSQLLTSKGIVNNCEIVTNTDWGSPEYGDKLAHIWVTDEDQVPAALQLYEAFLGNPEDPQFKAASHLPGPILPKIEASLNTAKTRLERVQQAASSWQAQSMGPVTLYIIIVCALLFFWSEMIRPNIEHIPHQVTQAIVVASPIKKALLYDYPTAYEYLDQFMVLSVEQKWKPEEPVPVVGQALLDKYATTPYWRGAYDVFVKYLRHENWQRPLQAPLFEKIRQGEVWRIESPALLHNDLLHILFNMLWLMVLGKQIEQRLGAIRYLLFCLIVGAFSNTLQYLMSGPNFIGISGILCGMLMYIWVRQHKAPWEGYQLQRGTFAFLGVFVLAMLAIQIVSFAGEVYWNQPLYSGIANTAHLSGALAGYLLGKLNYFSWKR